MKARFAVLTLLLLTIVMPVRAQEESAPRCGSELTFHPLGVLVALDSAWWSELMGDPQGAVDAYSQALKFGVVPNWTIYHARARNWQQLRESGNALDDLNCALSMAPWDLSLYRDRATLYAFTGENKLAEDDFRVVLDVLPDDPQSNLFLGLILVQSEAYEEALERLTSVEDLYNWNAYYYSRRAWAYYHTEQYRAAIADGGRALKLGLTSDEDLAYEVRARSFDALQDYEHAADEWTHVIELNPNHFQWYANRGQSYLNAKLYDEAIADFTYVLEHQDQAYGYYWRGLVYVNMEAYDLALADFDRIDKLDSDSYQGYVGRAQMYLELNDWESAIAEVTTAIRQNPESAPLYIYRAGFYIQQRNFDASMADFDTAFELEPPTSHNYYVRASAFMFWHQYEQGLEDLNEALRLDPENENALTLRGTAYFLMEDYDLAEADYERAKEMAPYDATVYLSRGYYFAHLREDYDQGIIEYTEAIRLLPNNYSAYINRASAYLQQRDYESALADAQTAVELGTDEIAPYIAVIGVYRERGDLEEALEASNRLVEDFPDESYAFLTRAEVYGSLGLEAEMFADLVTARQLRGTDYGEIDGLLGRYFSRIGSDRIALYYHQRAYDRTYLPSAEMFHQLAQSYDALERYEEALALYQRYIRMTDENADPEVVRRVAQLEAGQFDSVKPPES